MPGGLSGHGVTQELSIIDNLSTWRIASRTNSPSSLKAAKYPEFLMQGCGYAQHHWHTEAM